MVLAAARSDFVEFVNKNDRCTATTSSMSKMAKFYSKISSFSQKILQGTVFGSVAGTIAKPLKHFAEIVDVVNVIDPLNNLLAKDADGIPNYKNWMAQGKWVRLAARVTLIAGLALSPVIFAASLGWFPLGILGANIATYGSMAAIDAAKCALILTGATLGFFDRKETIKDELIAESNAQLQADLLSSLKCYAQNPVERHELAARVQLYRVLGDDQQKVNEVWGRFENSVKPTDGSSTQSDFLLKVAAEAENANRLLDQKHFKVVRTKTALQDDVCKIALLSLTFVGAFFVSGLMGTIFIAALGLYGAWTSWTRADMDVVTSEKKDEYAAWKKKNEQNLSNPILGQLQLA